MWNMVMERIPTMIEFFCAFLAFLVPFVTYRINQKLHKDMDPPWKQEEKSKEKSQKQPAN